MQTMTRKDEDELVRAVREAAYHYVQGDTPVDAIVKVATARNMPREHVNRVVEAFNVNATLAHFQRAEGAEKAAEFPTADLDEVFDKLYPKEIDSPVKEAALTWTPGPESYMEHTDFMAEELPSFSDKRASRGMSEAQAIETVADEYRREVAMLDCERSTLGQFGEQLMEAVDKYASYFTPLDGHQVNEIEDENLRAFVVERVPQLRKQGVASVGNPEKALVRALAARDLYAKQAQLVAAAGTELEKGAALVTARISAVKEAGFAGGFTGGLASAMLSDITDTDVSKSKDKINLRMSAPEVVAERKGIQTQAMLKTILEDDDVLKHAPQAEVVKAYNDLARVAPAVAANPMLLRGWMRRVVESRGLDPFDMHELVKTEKDLKKITVGGVDEEEAT